jgi:hypothetical protein
MPAARRTQSFAYCLYFFASNMGRASSLEETPSNETLFWNNFVKPHNGTHSRCPNYRRGHEGNFCMASSRDLRRYSGNCLAFAEHVSNPDDKARLLEMAQEFLELAMKQEQRDLQSTQD